MVHIVAYDLRTPHDTSLNYEKVVGAFKAQGVSKWVQDSVWLVESAKASTDLRDDIQRTAGLDARDRIFVARLDGMWDAQNLSPDAILGLLDEPS